MSKKNNVQLALAFDDKYITPFYVLLASLFINNKQNEVVIHTIVSGITDKDKNDITTYVQENNSEIIFYDIDLDYVSKLIVPEKDENPLTGAMYYRLFFPFLVPSEVQRLLYIDVDTLVVGDLAGLAALDLNGKTVGAVTDRDMPVRSDIGIHSVEHYFNSGVLLIDIAQWKANRISEKALKIISEEPDLIKGYPDQDALNMALRNDWYQLEPKYNVMRLYVPEAVPKRGFGSFLLDQKIIHYNGKKPWFSDCEHRLRHVYQQYARLSLRPEASHVTNVQLPKDKRAKLRRSRMIEFYFDHPELVTVWRRLKALVGR
ncbi:glycosyltransferase family 8 protein [Hymenobacter coccineus]|nr:glycosyltransferase family 8 protein [Hymenobacter coccineus]